MQAITNLWARTKFSLSTILLIGIHTAIAQSTYRVTDLGALHDGVFSCAMGLNNKGWTESMDGFLDKSGNFVARAAINVDGLKIDLGTLGGPNSWIWWGGINEQGEAVGFAETAVPDPDGEDFCFFGTNLTCRAFIWQNGERRALPNLGGNNGTATAINNRGQIAGRAQTTMTDSGCPPYHTALPVLWENGRVQQLPTVDGDPDGWAEGLNDHGQIVGGTGDCSQNNHAVLWENGSVVELPNLGNIAMGAEAFAINNRGDIVGTATSSDGSTFYGALWQNRIVTNLGTLPGDFAAIATGINEKGQVVGSTLDSNFNWSRAFIWQNGAMTDLNTLFPANSNLYATMANKINARGQISGMATVLSGPDAGNVHAFLATPVNASIAESIASIAVTHQKPTLPTNVGERLLQRLRVGRLRQ